MIYRSIPAGGFKVSIIALGTMTFGSPVGLESAAEITSYALDKGVNFIDTANMYEGYNRVAGSPGGVAEEIIGSALGKRRSGVYIATKLGMKVGNEPEDEGISASAIRKQLPLSLARLKTNWIDIYYLHKPGLMEELEDTLKELACAVKEGAIRCYGVSNYNAKQLRDLLNMAGKLGVQKPAACQPPLSILRCEALEELVPLCQSEGIAVVPYQIYQGGLLTGKYRRGEEAPQNSRAAEKPDWVWELNDGLYSRLEEIETAAGRMKLSMADYALGWVLKQPVASAIIGIKSIAQLDAAISAAERMIN